MINLRAGYTQNLEATLQAIVLIRDVFHLSLQEQDHQEGAGVRERYETYKNAAIYKNETYKNAAIYKNETQLEFEFDFRCHGKRYETYKNAAIYKNKTQLEFEFDLHCHDSQ